MKWILIINSTFPGFKKQDCTLCVCVILHFYFIYCIWFLMWVLISPIHLQVGHVQPVSLTPHRTHEMKTISLKPLIFGKCTKVWITCFSSRFRIDLFFVKGIQGTYHVIYTYIHIIYHMYIFCEKFITAVISPRNAVLVSNELPLD